MAFTAPTRRHSSRVPRTGSHHLSRALRADAQRRAQLAQIADDRESGYESGFRILARYVLDGHREAGGIGVDLYRVSIAAEFWIRPDFQCGLVGANAGE